ncbi:MAG: protein-L-isoaspartate(D-aspartate) O-methyltransferase [Bryobacteraceae bacterium]|nr:protein-L-isoaspartate(D-aspartate) O-methyltransferase [Bryobacteraceae bacterium]
MNGASTAMEALRWHMVEKQLKARGIADPRVLEAMSRIPREEFVPERFRREAYADEPISIGHGQTISQPYITALMAQTLELKGHEKVLEVGAGSGYHAAVLGALAAEVITLEIIPELAELARRNLAGAGYDRNVRVVCGDGSLGYPETAPYDAISVAAGAPATPDQLLAQLAGDGRMVVPVGSYDEQKLMVFVKAGDALTSRVATYCRFVPLRGGGGWNAR